MFLFPCKCKVDWLQVMEENWYTAVVESLFTEQGYGLYYGGVWCDEMI